MPGMMPGMMSEADMTRFMAASGPALDRMFLEMMIRHHEGAVTMADTEETQTAEIATMRQLLAR